MIDLLFTEAVQAALEPQFSGVYVGPVHDNREIDSPSITLDMRSDALVGGPLYRGTLTANITTQADDTTPSEHQTLVQSVDAALKDINLAGSAVTLYGIVATGVEAQRSGRQWTSALSYIVGFGPQTL